MTRMQIVLVVLAVVMTRTAAAERPLERANEILFEALRSVHAITATQEDSLRALFRRSGYIGQGNPAISVHPMTEFDCEARLTKLQVSYDNPEFEEICGRRYMAPLYDPEKETMEQARVCIDQFEFPNIPCTYPVVWVRANEAARICEILGKRMCDAHEWEGACAGSLQPPDYDFALAQQAAPHDAVGAMRRVHNRLHAVDKSWGYGPVYRSGICATSGRKSSQCDGGSWHLCGSNTFPSGAFPDCRSALFVYDLHGNAAEHMNLPLTAEQMASRGSVALGYTEMKGSWFVFDSVHAHEDWCRWRAPYWHGSRVRDPKSHHNYHLGFRCCESLEQESR